MTIANCFVCLLNFNKGLKPYVSQRKIRSEEEKADNVTEMPDLKHNGVGGVVANRMTID